MYYKKDEDYKGVSEQNNEQKEVSGEEGKDKEHGEKEDKKTFKTKKD